VLQVTRRTLDLQYPKEARRVLLIPTNYATVCATRTRCSLCDFILQVGQELIGILGAARADLVLSLLSLQHMIPQLQVAALEHLCDVLAFGGFGFVQLLTGYTPSPYVDADCNPSRAIEEPGMQLHFLPLHEANRHLALRGCTVLSTKPCDDHVAVPGRASTAHCIVFTRSAT